MRNIRDIESAIMRARVKALQLREHLARQFNEPATRTAAISTVRDYWKYLDPALKEQLRRSNPNSATTLDRLEKGE